MSTDMQPSKLGTREHWDSVYEEELANFEEIGDEGEVWFGAESVEMMTEWSSEHVPYSMGPAVIEIGSGNGTLLFALCEAGYSAALMAGIDYSPGAVKLAKSIAATRGDGVGFHVCDFLTEEPPAAPSNPLGLWDLALDKGTYDAIALGKKDDHGNSPIKDYPHRVSKLLRPGGYFLITSCNFTEDELRVSFITAETGLTYHSRIQHPVFTFGGRKGSAYSTVAFRKESGLLPCTVEALDNVNTSP